MKRLEAKQEAKEEKQRLLNIEEARLVKAELEIMVKEEDGKKNSKKNGQRKGTVAVVEFKNHD